MNPKTLIENNVYFAFNNPSKSRELFGKHQITVAYDEIPFLSEIDHDILISQNQPINLRKVEVDLEKARRSQFIVIGIKRGGYSQKELLSYFEILFTKDIFYEVNYDETVSYSLVEGQSLYILNNDVNLQMWRTFTVEDTHEYIISGNSNEYKAYAYNRGFDFDKDFERYNSSSKFKYSSVRAFLKFPRVSQFSERKSFYFSDYSSHGSVMKLTALTNTAGTIQITSDNGNKKRFRKDLKFLH